MEKHMIRSTVNVGIKTIVRDPAHKSQSIERTYGSSNGVLDPAFVEIDEATYDAATGNTYSPIHSNEHWDGSTIKR